VHVHAAADDRAALARCVGDVDRFASEVWGRAALLCRGDGERGFGDLFGLEAVDSLLTATVLRLPAFRLVQDGTPLDPARYTRRMRLGGRPVDDVADPAQVEARFAEGATLVLQGLHRYWLPLSRFCRSLERVLGHGVQANAYVTPAGAQGLGLHADDHDVFTLQVLGRKSWTAYAPEADPASGAAPVIDTEVGPGDTMYLPRGARHAARTTAVPSIHLTIGVLPTSWSSVLDAALATAGEGLGLADPLPFGWPADEAGFSAAVEAWLGRVASALGEVDAASVAAAVRQVAPDRRPPLPVGSFSSLVRLDELDDATVLRRREGTVAEVVPEGERVALVLADRTLRLPAEVEPVLRRVVASPSVRGADLGEDVLDEAGRRVLLRRLVREGLLEAVG
jgi:bifunctional lysine-specific demethylase and histidyl-hydroxylase NO66